MARDSSASGQVDQRTPAADHRVLVLLWSADVFYGARMRHVFSPLPSLLRRGASEL